MDMMNQGWKDEWMERRTDEWTEEWMEWMVGCGKGDGDGINFGGF